MFKQGDALGTELKSQRLVGAARADNTSEKAPASTGHGNISQLNNKRTNAQSWSNVDRTESKPRILDLSKQ